MITPDYVLRRLREQLRYLHALHELTRIDRGTPDDIGIAPEQLPALARRHALGLPPLDRALAG